MRKWKATNDEYFPTLQNGGVEIVLEHRFDCYRRTTYWHVEMIDLHEVAKRYHAKLERQIHELINEHRELGNLIAEHVDGVPRPAVRALRTH